MVRRVGFGDSGDDGPNRSQRAATQAGIAKKGARKSPTRLIVGGFLVVWLIAWSAAIAASVATIISDGLGAADIGLFIWVAVAALFWLLAVHMLWRVVTGRPLGRDKGRRSKPRQYGLDGARGDWDHGEND